MPQIKCLDERVLPNDAAWTSGHVLVLPASNANPHQRDAMSGRRAEQGEIPPRNSEQRKNCCGDCELAKAWPGWPGRLSSTELNDIIVHLRFLLAPHHTLFRASNSKCQKEKGAQSFTKRLSVPGRTRHKALACRSPWGSRKTRVTMKSQHGLFGLCFNALGWSEQEGAMKRVVRGDGDSV